MPIRYNLISIPKTRSDKIDKKGELHYLLKVILLKHLNRIKKLPRYEEICYDEILINQNIYGAGYIPDVAFVNNSPAWIELETDPFNIFKKLTTLLYLYKLKPSFWPKQLIFGTVEPKNKEIYIRTFMQLIKLIKIKNINLYFINTEYKEVKLEV